MSRFEVGQTWKCRGGHARLVTHVEPGGLYPVASEQILPVGFGRGPTRHDAAGFYLGPNEPCQYDLTERALVIYVAGPMTGYPDLNFPAFHAKAAELRAAGYVVINPAEINGGEDELVACANMTPEELAAHWQKCMRKDITALCTCDGIAMLDGWTKSRGATLEHHVAKSLGLLVIEAAA